MFPATYFAPRYFAPRFFPKVGSGGVSPTQTPAPFTSMDGGTLFVPFDQDVVGFIANQYVLSGGHTLSTPIGSGSGGLHGTIWAVTITPPLQHGEAPDLDYAGASTKNFSNNLLGTFSAHPVTNNVPLGVPSINADATEATAPATVVGWFAVTGATGYRIQRSLDGASWGAAVVLGNVLTYSDTTTTNGVSYFYRVGASDASGTSAYSDAFGPIVALGPGDGSSGGGTGGGSSASAQEIAEAIIALISASVPINVITPCSPQYLDLYRRDAYTSDAANGRALTFTRQATELTWPAVIAEAHFYAEPTPQTLDKYSGAIGISDVQCDVTVASGDGRQIILELTSTQMASLQEGLGEAVTYQWWLVANKSTFRATVRAGVMRVRPSPAVLDA